MTNETAEMRQIHDIRLAIYEEIKDMTPDERTVYFAASSRETIKKYGINVGTPEKRLGYRDLL